MKKDYSKFEKYVSDQISDMPRLKSGLKKINRFLNRLRYMPKDKYKSILEISSVVPNSHEDFFGYYDKNPQNYNGRYIAYHRTCGSTHKNPSTHNRVEICLYDNTNEEVILIDETKAFNWQQGSRLHWISDEKLIYNIYVDGAYKAKSYCLKTKTTVIYELAIYDTHEELYSLCIDFEKLSQLRPDYGYFAHRNSYMSGGYNVPEGIVFQCLKSKERKQIISLTDLMKCAPCETMRGAEHKINHVMISPDGEKFLFLHRWVSITGKRHDRLCLGFKDGKFEHLTYNTMVSHFCWNGNSEIICFMFHESYKEQYYRININTLKVELLSQKLVGLGDGHPSIREQSLLFDTYPDKIGYKHLYKFDLASDQLIHLGAFIEPLKFFGVNRCDLHPRWGIDTSYIYIDSTHCGKRKLYELRCNA